MEAVEEEDETKLRMSQLVGLCSIQLIINIASCSLNQYIEGE